MLTAGGWASLLLNGAKKSPRHESLCGILMFVMLPRYAVTICSLSSIRGACHHDHYMPTSFSAFSNTLLYVTVPK